MSQKSNANLLPALFIVTAIVGRGCGQYVCVQSSR